MPPVWITVTKCNFHFEEDAEGFFWIRITEAFKEFYFSPIPEIFDQLPSAVLLLSSSPHHYGPHVPADGRRLRRRYAPWQAGERDESIRLGKHQGGGGIMRSAVSRIFPVVGCFSRYLPPESCQGGGKVSSAAVCPLASGRGLKGDGWKVFFPICIFIFYVITKCSFSLGIEGNSPSELSSTRHQGEVSGASAPA